MIKKISLVLLIVAQLAVPASFMKTNERILNKGVVYKFKTAPVDPYDIFRGRYVALRNEQNTAPLSSEDDKKIAQNKHIGYALINVDKDGYAYVERLVADKPMAGNYFKTRIMNYMPFEGESSANFTFPVDRYYMNEKKAPQAEALYLKHSTREKRDAYMVVRILNGEMVIESLMLGDQSIESYL